MSLYRLCVISGNKTFKHSMVFCTSSQNKNTEKQNFKQILFGQPEFIRHCQEGLFWQGALAEASVLDTFFSWEELNRIFATTRITRDRLRLSTKATHSSLNQRVFKPGRDALGRPTELLSLNDLHELLQHGATGIVEAIDEVSPAVAELVEALAAQYSVRSSANAYISFGSVPGFGVHYDDHDILVIQIAGQKKWRFFNHQILTTQASPLPSSRIPAPTEASEEIILDKGSLLFVPKGIWHEVVALDEPTLHLTFSLISPTLNDYIHWLLKRYPDSLSANIKDRERRNLNIAINKCTDFFEQTLSANSLEQFLQVHKSLYVANKISVSLPLLNRVSLEEKFRWVPQHIIDLDIPNDAQAPYIVTALGKKYTLTQAAYRVLMQLSITPAKTGKDICIQLDEGECAWAWVAPALENLLQQGLISKYIKNI